MDSIKTLRRLDGTTVYTLQDEAATQKAEAVKATVDTLIDSFPKDPETGEPIVTELSTVARTGKYSDLTDIPTFATVATSGKYTDLIDAPPASVFFRCTLNEDYTVNTFDDGLNYNNLTTLGATGAEIFIGAQSYNGCTLMFQGLGHHVDTGTPAYIFSTTFEHVDDPNYMRTLFIEVREGVSTPITSMYVGEKAVYKRSSTDGWQIEPSDIYYPSEKLVKNSIDAKADADALTAEETARSEADSALSDRIAKLEGTINYFLLHCGEDKYIDPSTLIEQTRTYEIADFSTDEIGDINIKAWLKVVQGLEEIEELDSAAVQIHYEVNSEIKHINWEYWQNKTNSQISSYPSLQQTGMYVNEGTGEISPFTNDTYGSIKGSTTDGFVQSDAGLGKVSGWDTVKSDITTLQGQVREPGTSSPKMDGVAAIGTSAKYAREDHVHPTDTTLDSKYQLKYADFSGAFDSTFAFTPDFTHAQIAEAMTAGKEPRIIYTYNNGQTTFSGFAYLSYYYSTDLYQFRGHLFDIGYFTVYSHVDQGISGAYVEFEKSSRKANSLESTEVQTSDTWYPSAKATVDYFNAHAFRAPDIIYQATAEGSGLDPKQDDVGDCSASLSGLSLSKYRFVRAYVRTASLDWDAAYDNPNIVIDIPTAAIFRKNGYSATGVMAAPTKASGGQRFGAVCSIQINGDGNDNFYFNQLLRYSSATPATLSGSSRQVVLIEGWY